MVFRARCGNGGGGRVGEVGERVLQQSLEGRRVAGELKRGGNRAYSKERVRREGRKL